MDTISLRLLCSVRDPGASCRFSWMMLLAALILTGCRKAAGPEVNPAPHVSTVRTLSSFDSPKAGDRVFPAGAVKFDHAELPQVLGLYAEVSGRSMILGANLPYAEITFSNQAPMGAIEVLQALDTVLAAQGITAVSLGTQYVKVVAARDAAAEPGPIVELRPDQLPDSSSFLIYLVKVKGVTTSRAVPVLSPFSKLPNSILAIGPPGSNKKPASDGALPNPPISFGTEETIFIFRDYSSNVRRMLKVLQELERQ